MKYISDVNHRMIVFRKLISRKIVQKRACENKKDLPKVGVKMSNESETMHPILGLVNDGSACGWLKVSSCVIMVLYFSTALLTNGD